MKQYYPYIILALVIGIGSFFLLQQNRQIKGLKAQQEVINDALESQKEENTRLIDSLIITSKKELIERQTQSIDSLTKLWNNRPKTSKYDPNIDRITDNDSIKQLFSKYYPNNP